MPRPRRNAVWSRQQALLNLPAIYCPKPDPQMRSAMRDFCRAWPDAITTPFEGGEKRLGILDPRAPLYVIMHGHGQMPLFTSKTGKLNATQMAAALESDGLDRAHRDLHLLVCHAGESVTSRVEANRRIAIQTKYSAAVKAKDAKAIKALEGQYKKSLARGPGPSAFTEKGQAHPLAAQLMAAMKRRQYRNLRIISYGAPVCIAFNVFPGQVHLDLTNKIAGGRWGMDSRQHPQFVKIWH